MQLRACAALAAAAALVSCRREIPTPPVTPPQGLAEVAAAPLAAAPTNVVLAEPVSPVGSASPVRERARPGPEFGAEGALLGIDDAATLLDLVAARLARQAPELAVQGTQRWGVRAQTESAVTLSAEATALTWTGPADDLQVVMAEAKCTIRAVPGQAQAAAPCPPDMADLAGLAAVLPVLARADLRAAVRVESLQWSGQGPTAKGSLRLSVPAWRTRWNVDIASEGRLLGAQLAGTKASFDWVEQKAQVRMGDEPVLTWQWPAPQSAVRTVLWVPTDGSNDMTLTWQHSARQRRLFRLGPQQVEFNWTGAELQFRATSAAVLGSAAAGPKGTAQVRAEPVLSLARAEILWLSLANAPQQLRGLAPGCYVAQVLGGQAGAGSNAKSSVILRSCN